ncbi:MAG: rhomboid family intramembrane serine protease [Gemmataceae bacterium]
MGYQNREYYREGSPSAWSMEDAPVVKWILIVTVAIYLLQIFIVRDNPVPDFDVKRTVDSEATTEQAKRKKFYDDTNQYLQDLIQWSPQESVVTRWLELDPKTTLKQGQIWRLVTVAFCHDRFSLFHIAFNMIVFFMFGREMERIYGSREFLMFYLSAALVSSLAFLGIAALTGSQVPAVGASGAVMGIVMLFTMHYPRHTILLFWVIPIEMRYAMAIYIIVDLYPLLRQLSGERFSTGIGHAAHLGGALMGFVYYKYHWRLSGILDRIPSRPRQQRVRSTSTKPERPNSEMLIYKFPQRTRLSQQETEEVDRILAKISIVGKDGLTDEESEVLNRASNTLKWKRDYTD